MKVADFNNVISKIPIHVALFKVKKVPPWASPWIKVNDFMVYDPLDGSLHLGNLRGGIIGLGATYIEFAGFEPRRDYI